MLNICGLIRPLTTTAFVLIMLSIVAPVFFSNTQPYIAAAAVLAVPWFIYRWWNARYNPGCGVRLSYVPAKQENADDTP